MAGTHQLHRDEGQRGHLEDTLMMKEESLEGSQKRAGKKDCTRDPHLSQQPTTAETTKNNSPSCLESWPALWDEEQESQRNPLPSSNATNIQIYTGGC